MYRYADDQYINEAVEGVKGYEERERILREQFESLDPLCCVQHVREYSRIDEFDVYTEPPSWYQESTEELPRFPTRDYEVEPGDSWAKIAQRSDVWLTHQAVRHFEHGNPFERSG